MNKMQQQVEDFRRAMGLEISPIPRVLSPKEAELHIKMIRDEFEKELVPALLEGKDLVEIYDGIIDVIYFMIGLASNAGLDIEPGFTHVHDSNMSKLDPETGLAIKAGPNDPSGEPEGKVLKGPAYFKPNLAPIINDIFRYGPTSDAVLESSRVPLTWEFGGQVIGEADVAMDKDGNIAISGIVFNPEEDIPMLNALTITGLSIDENYKKPVPLDPDPEELEPADDQTMP